MCSSRDCCYLYNPDIFIFVFFDVAFLLSVSVFYNLCSLFCILLYVYVCVYPAYRTGLMYLPLSQAAAVLAKLHLLPCLW